MSDTVVVVTPTPTQVVVIGQQGPAGPAGGGGFEFTQATALSTWVVNHNLGHRVNCTVLDLGRNKLFCSETQPSANQIVLTFDTPQAGYAIIS